MAIAIEKELKRLRQEYSVDCQTALDEMDGIGRKEADKQQCRGSLTKEPSHDGREAVIGMTVQEFLQAHASSKVCFFTPGGYVRLDAGGISRLLGGSPVQADAGGDDVTRMAEAEEILPQKILSGTKRDGIWHLMTDSTDEED